MKSMMPNYNNCLVNVTNSILKYYDCETYHNTLKELDNILTSEEYKNIVLMLYDGMSSNLLKRNLSENAFLNKHKYKDIDAVFPPTTTASTTSVLTGKNPNEHGWLGWDLYFPKIDKTVSMFNNTLKDTDIVVSDKSISKETYPYESIVDIIKDKVNSYALFPFGQDPYKNIDEMCERIIDICKDDTKNFIYAYNEEPDHTMHITGTDSKETISLFEEINEKTEKLCQNLKDTLVMIVADHGHINSECIILKDYPEIYNLLERETSIEPRSCAFYIKNGEEEHFKELFDKNFSEDFLLLTNEEVINKKVFGLGENNKYFNESIGDFLAVAISDKYFLDDDLAAKYKSTHAGITEDEVRVPLILVKK